MSDNKNTNFVVPENYENDPEIQPILEYLKNNTSNRPVMITGKAGTGKSTLINYISNSDEFENVVVLAPTGIAAQNIGGQTLHSFFYLPAQIITGQVIADQKFQNKAWRTVDTIIIDEVSMVRCDMMDGINAILKKARNNPAPFGGVQMVMLGDFYQLPPVAKYNEQNILKKMGYPKNQYHCFNSKAFTHFKPKTFELKTVHRQKDAKFLGLLSDLRDGSNPYDVVEQFNELCHKNAKTPSPEDTPLILCAKNNEADNINAAGLEYIDNELFEYEGLIHGDFRDSDFRNITAPRVLSLKIGARVMALRNGPCYVNGSLGVVQDLSENSVTVLFDNGIEAEIEKVSFEKVKYTVNGSDIVHNVVGSFEQFPIRLSWAVSIHKSQGLTLDRVCINLASGAFASGQTYVALSRCRTLEGLYLNSPIKLSDIIVDKSYEEWCKREEGVLAEEKPLDMAIPE